MGTGKSSLPQQRVLTWRAISIFIISAPINCYFLIQMELVRYTFPTWVVPLSNVIFILTAVMLMNGVIRLLRSNFALGQGELLFLYVTLSFATSLAGCDVFQAILSVLGHSFWFATEENEWRTLFWHHLPEWLTVSDRDALRGYYLGESSLYSPLHLRVWVPVIGAWLLLFSVIAFIFLCLNTILRRQWAQRERLTFPIIQLPLAMTNPTSGFFRNKRMWIGFCNRCWHQSFQRIEPSLSRDPAHSGDAPFFLISGGTLESLRHDHHGFLPVCDWYYVPHAVRRPLFDDPLLFSLSERSRFGKSGRVE